MMKNLPWILSTVLAIVIIAMIVFKKDPPHVATVEDYESKRKLKENEQVISDLESRYDSLERKMKSDSVTKLKGDSASQAKISRLTRQLRAIDTRKATSKQLDSLINLLYGD